MLRKNDDQVSPPFEQSVIGILARQSPFFDCRDSGLGDSVRFCNRGYSGR